MPATAVSGRRRERMPILAAVLGLLYGGLALVNGADRVAATKVSKAERLPRALAVEALGVAGERAIADARYDDALAIAQRAVRRAPIEPSSAALLGAAWLGKGDADRAREAFTVAGRLGWRVPLTQIYWMREALDAGDVRIAALRLDALLRQQPALLREDQLLAPIEVTPEGRAALAARLATRPPWLADYLNDHGDASRDAMLRRAAVLGLLAMPRPGLGQRLGCDAIRPMVARLEVLGELVVAQRVSQDHCAANKPSATLPGA
jgi:hypothetical protein